MMRLQKVVWSALESVPAPAPALVNIVHTFITYYQIWIYPWRSTDLDRTAFITETDNNNQTRPDQTGPGKIGPGEPGPRQH